LQVCFTKKSISHFQQQIPASTGFPVFDEYEPTFKLDFPLRDYHAPLRDIFAPGSQEEASSH